MQIEFIACFKVCLGTRLDADSKSSAMSTVFFGTIVHTKSFNEFESFEKGFLVVPQRSVACWVIT